MTAKKNRDKSGNPAKTKGAAKRLEILKRQERVAELRLQGYSSPKIAEVLGISPRQARIDIQRIGQRWRESSIRNWDEMREIQRLRLEEIHRKACESYELSLKPREVITVDKNEDGKTKTTVRREFQAGDASFLEVQRKTSESLRKMFGLDQEQTTSGVAINVNVNADADDRRTRLAQLAKRLGAKELVVDGAAIPVADDLSPVAGASNANGTRSDQPAVSSPGNESEMDDGESPEADGSDRDGRYCGLPPQNGNGKHPGH